MYHGNHVSNDRLTEYFEFDQILPKKKKKSQNVGPLVSESSGYHGHSLRFSLDADRRIFMQPFLTFIEDSQVASCTDHIFFFLFVICLQPLSIVTRQST